MIALVLAFVFVPAHVNETTEPVEGKPYELYFVCKPQECAARRFEVMFEAGGKRAYGALGGPGEPPAYYGDPPPPLQAALAEALKG